MTPDDLLSYDGVDQSISEWALDYGIPAELIIDRLNAGRSVEDAITAPMEVAPGQRLPDPRAKLYTHNGETLTLKDWSRRTGIPKATLADRVGRGMPIGDAIDPDHHPKKNVTYTHDGQTLTLGEWARRTGIKYSTLRHRVNSAGMSIGDAINMAMHAKPSSASRAGPTPLPIGFVITIGTVRIEITDLGREVVSNLKASEGTGVGSAAQETPNLEISQ